MKKMGAQFLYAILAGICIGLGGTIYLRLRDAFPGGQVVGALLFAIGLFTICTRGYSLYTGKVSYLLDNRNAFYVLSLPVIWLGNLLGCMLIAWLESLTLLAGPMGIDAVARGMIDAKMNSSYLSLFILGILCNIFIFIAISGYHNNPHQLGKYLSLFLGVSIFILAGTEHSIADMYYWCISGEIYRTPGESLLRILTVTLGNSVGGLFLPLTEHLKARLDATPVVAPSIAPIVSSTIPPVISPQKKVLF